MGILGVDVVARFQGNEQRFDDFLNIDGTYLDKFNNPVETLPSLVNTVAAMTLTSVFTGPWVTAHVYNRNQISKKDGINYICKLAHTSGTFATDLGAGKWQIYEPMLLDDMPFILVFGDGVTDNYAQVLAANNLAVANNKFLLFCGISHFTTQITLTAPIFDTLCKIFSETTNVKITNNPIVRPEWWKTNAVPGTTDMTVAINAASLAATSTVTLVGQVTFTSIVKFLSKTYRHNATLTYHGAPWEGSGVLSTILDYYGTSGPAVNAVGTLTARKVLSLKELTLSCYHASGTAEGLRLGHNYRSLCAFDNVKIAGSPNAGIYFEQDIWVMSGRDLNVIDCLGSAFDQGPSCANLFQIVWFNMNVEGCGKVGTPVFNFPNAGSTNNWIMYGGDFESNRGTCCFYFKGGNQVFDGLYFEETDLASNFILDSSNFVIERCWSVLGAATTSLIRTLNSQGSVKNNYFYWDAYWVTGTVYAVGRWVNFNNGDQQTTYKCAIAHTAGTFATDLAAGKWVRYDSSSLSVEGDSRISIDGNLNMNAGIAAGGTPILSTGTTQVIDGWGFENLPAPSNTLMSRGSGAASWANKFVANRSGLVTGIILKSNTPRTAGTAKATLLINGVARTVIQAVLDATNTTFCAKRYKPENSVWFAEGDEITVAIQTGADWLPVTADVTASLEVLF